MLRQTCLDGGPCRRFGNGSGVHCSLELNPNYLLHDVSDVTGFQYNPDWSVAIPRQGNEIVYFTKRSPLIETFVFQLDPDAGKEFMGWIVSANPVGQMIFSPLVGWWSNRLGSIRLPLLVSLALFSIASGIYSTLELFTSHHKYWMMYSRFLIGVSSASIAVCRSYLSAATKVRERTGAVSMVSLAQTLGFIVGPALQGLVTPLGDRGVPLFKDKLYLNMYTATGWINVVMGIMNFCLFLPFFFKEKRIAAKEAMVQQGKDSEKETWKALKPDYVSAWSLIFAFFILVFNFVFLET